MLRPLHTPFHMTIIVWLLLCEFRRNVVYVCPHCGAVFKPSLREMLFSIHTSKARKLTCPQCHEKRWCAERLVKEEVR